MTEGKSQKEAALDERDIAREELQVLGDRKRVHKFSDEDSDNSHSKGTELDNNQTKDKRFYKEDRDTPTCPENLGRIARNSGQNQSNNF
jgi:hypothetical protein